MDSATRYKIGPGGIAMAPLTDAQRAAARRASTRARRRRPGGRVAREVAMATVKKRRRINRRMAMPRLAQMREILKTIDGQ